MKSFLSIALIFSLFIGSSLAIDANCAIRAETCAPNKSCCVGLYCHSRLATLNIKACYQFGLPGDKCTTGSGIPCVKDSVCLPMKNVCSKRFSEICTDNHGICRPDSECISIGIGKQSKKEIFKCIITGF